MNGSGITLFRLFGFEVKMNITWLVLAFLIAWSLASGIFPSDYQGLRQATYWIMGVICTVGIFLSIVVHEFSHSMIARRFAIPIRSITLMIFGGVAEMDEEPPNPRAEFYMSIAGPLSSFFLGCVFFLLFYVSRRAVWPPAVTGVVRYLRDINFIIAVFNLVPAFPLDGGRILRSALWRWRGDLKWATRISSAIGSGFGILLIVFGMFTLFRGAWINGLWWILIGFFVRNASRSSYQRTLIFETLKGEPVARFMKSEVVSVDPDIAIERLVEDYVYKYHYKMLPVARGRELMGCVTTRDIKKVPREEWGDHTVREIYEKCNGNNSIGAQEDATEALQRMNKTGNSRLLVTENGDLAGILSLKDLLKFLSLKLDLEGGGRLGFSITRHD
ncbi:MAG: site-2 protease family protein [Spirochaetales bacterium]|nr:site-2 protease family protein [Spirochaetales bacterium]